MKIAGRSILLTALLMYPLPGNARASTSGVPSDVSNRTLLSQPRDYRFNLLFAQQAEDSTKLRISPSLKLKSPYTAVFYSVIPGAVFHGAGHVYAGKIGTGIALFGSELVGLGLMSVGAIAEFGEEESGDKGGTAAFVGLVLFFGSWVYDLIESPAAVNKRNAELLKQKPAGVEFRTRDGQLRLVAVWRF